MSADEQLPGLEVQGRAGGALVRAVQAAVAAASLDARDEALGALAVESAHNVELAKGRRDPYAHAAAQRELHMHLKELQLTPAARQGADAGGIEAWLQTLQAE